MKIAALLSARLVFEPKERREILLECTPKVRQVK
jgi:hypothetical protein